MGGALPGPGTMSKPTGNIHLALAGPALRAFTQIASAWKLTEHEQSAILGCPKSVALELLENGGAGGEDFWPETLERVSYVLGIYHALHILFPEPNQADNWIRCPNTSSPFKGATAIDLMCSGRVNSLAAVREYLDAQGLAEP